MRAVSRTRIPGLGDVEELRLPVSEGLPLLHVLLELGRGRRLSLLRPRLGLGGEIDRVRVPAVLRMPRHDPADDVGPHGAHLVLRGRIERPRLLDVLCLPLDHLKKPASSEPPSFITSTSVQSWNIGSSTN